MAKFYRKKPIPVEAWQFKGTLDDMPTWLREHPMFKGTNALGELIIKTLSGKTTVRRGDYVLKGVVNELYPCDEMVFKTTYEPVEEVA